MRLWREYNLYANTIGDKGFQMMTIDLSRARVPQFGRINR